MKVLFANFCFAGVLALGTVTPTALHPGAVVLPVADYALSGISYDLNGNLLSLTRKGQADVSLNMDQLTYHYPLSSGHRTNNRLDRVTDAQSTTAYSSEINLPAGQQAQNYRYTANGQLKSDVLEEKYYTYYAGNGRVKGVYADDDFTTEPLASFTYDASGNRLCKTGYASGTAIERTWYLRDAGGSLLCYHKQDLVALSTTEELPIPGVGTYLRSTTNVRYELTDHLGNTRVSFTYASNVITIVEAHDYYPHGGLLPGRQLTGMGASPLAYQGQEYDAEVGLTAFNLRQYDARLGRWLTPDPYGQHYSPYLAMSNNPVSFIDPDGGYDWQDYHNDSQAEALAGLQQMRQATNPEYYADQLTSARLANGQELNMNDMITVTMLRFYQRNPERGESDEVLKSEHIRLGDGSMAFDGAGAVDQGTGAAFGVMLNYTYAKTAEYTFWLGNALSETKGALRELMHDNHAFSSAVVQNPNLSNELRGQALVMRNDEFSKAVHGLVTSIMPIPAMGAASGGARAAMTAGRIGARSTALANSSVRLRNQLAGLEIAGGHAFSKHAAQFGFKSSTAMAAHIERVMTNPTAMRSLSKGRSAYWDDVTKSVVIRNPSAIDGGTAFKPRLGRAYFDNLK